MFSISKLLKAASDCLRKVVERWMGAIDFLVLLQAQLTIADNAIGSPRSAELTGTRT